MSINKSDFKRTKQKSTSSIVYDKGAWKFLVKTKKYGFDSELRKWVKYATVESYADLSSQGYVKEVTLTMYIKRIALDSSTLKEVSKWFKLVRKIKVKDKSSNLFLKLCDGRVFQTDLSITCPISLNHINEGLAVQDVSMNPLSPQELNALNETLTNEKVYVKPFIAEELQSGEIRLLT